MNDAAEHARAVFLAGNDLPARWRGRQHFVVLETAFGAGHGLLATWEAWRRDPQRPERLWFLTQAPSRFTGEQLLRAHPGSALAQELAATWPPATPDIHSLALDAGRVQVLLGRGGASRALSKWVAQVDAFMLSTDAAHPHAAPPEARALARLAASDATLAGSNSHPAWKDALAAAGFQVQHLAPTAGQTGVITARYQPRHQPVRPPGRRSAARVGSALVVGAGLAGAATARALAEQGVACTVVDAAPGPAHHSSGNAGGLFHGVVHGDDGPHARWFRACALRAQGVLAPWVRAGQLPGAVDGLLRLESALDTAEMQARLACTGLPPDHLQAVGSDQVNALAGLPPAAQARPGWFYPGGGWVSPAALCALLLNAEGIRREFGLTVNRIEPQDDGWWAHDASGRRSQWADVLVLANAQDAGRLAQPFGAAAWPALQRVRGQVTLVPRAMTQGQRLLRPLAGAGYALSLPDGRLLCGATAQEDDDEPALRADDQQWNLERLAALTGLVVDAPTPLAGRVGWRLLAPDRLPLLGPLPQDGARAPRADQARMLPRVPGLYVHTALGSRGISQALLGAEVLAAWITGAPQPVDADLLDAVDVARFAARAARQS